MTSASTSLRILFGVQTTGHGHLVRSTPLIQGLRQRGHPVEVLLSGPPAESLWLERIGQPRNVRTGLTFSAEGGRIRYLKTLREARPVRFIRDTLGIDTRPYDLVVCDYEPITAWAARRQRVQSIGIGHLYAFAHPSVPRARGNPLTHLVMDQFAPTAVPIGSHWDAFGAPILPPFVAPEARELRRAEVDSDLIVVYLGFEPLERTIPLLQQFPERRFRVYARVAAPRTVRNVELRPVSRTDFLADLARCRGVIANAGFTLASECLHLGVSLLVKPVHGQLEQESNALALERLKLASVSRSLDRRDVASWLERPAPAAARYPDVTGGLLEWLAAGAAEPVESLSQRLWQAAGATGRS